MKAASITLRVIAGVLFLASCYYFGYTTRILGETVYALFMGKSSVSAVNIPVSIVLLLFTTSSITCFLRPTRILWWLYGAGVFALALGWAMLTPHLIVFVLLGLGWGAYYWNVEQELSNNVRFQLHSVSRGWWWLKIAMIVVICAGVLWGGQAYMNEHELTKPNEQMNRVAEYLSERLPENQLGLSTNDVSTVVRGELDKAFDTFIAPQEQTFVWMIVIALFIPLLLAFIPMGWIVLGLMWGVVYLGNRFGFLDKQSWEVKAERLLLH